MYIKATPVIYLILCTEVHSDFLMVICKNLACRLTDSYYSDIYNMMAMNLLDISV